MSIKRDDTFNTVKVIDNIRVPNATFQPVSSLPQALNGSDTLWTNSSDQILFTNTAGTTVNLTNPNVIQSISTNQAILSTATLITVDNSSSRTLTLSDGTVGDTKTIKLLYTYGSDVTITTSKGTILLFPSKPAVDILYTSNGWIVMGSQDDLVSTTQQGPKLVGSGVTPGSGFGSSIALSADGNTFVTGSPINGLAGSVWVYVRNAGVWSEQVKLASPGGTSFGISVDISDDGNTIAVGADGSGVGTGTVYIYIRSGVSWNLQATLVGSGSVVPSRQGVSVSLSSDGNTVAFGGSDDNGGIGAAWVFTRSGAVWTQQGNKLIGTGAIGGSNQGYSVSLSAGGNVLVVGGPFDNGSVGACWVFIRSGVAWAQLSTKITGTGLSAPSTFGQSTTISGSGSFFAVGAAGNIVGGLQIGAVVPFSIEGTGIVQISPPLTPLDSDPVTPARMGQSVAISGDGQQIITGGSADNNEIGAVWRFVRKGNIWSQYGNKLIGSGGIPLSLQGVSVASSSNASTIAWGGTADNDNTGAIWVFI